MGSPILEVLKGEDYTADPGAAMIQVSPEKEQLENLGRINQNLVNE
jgi:hypothetical protein